MRSLAISSYGSLTGSPTGRLLRHMSISTQPLHSLGCVLIVNTCSCSIHNVYRRNRTTIYSYNNVFVRRLQATYYVYDVGYPKPQAVSPSRITVAVLYPRFSAEPRRIRAATIYPGARRFTESLNFKRGFLKRT